MDEAVRTPALELREERYATLFQGELPYDPLPPEAVVGISGLSRMTRRSGRRLASLEEHLEVLPEIVDAVLTNHDIAAHNQKDAAIFAFINKHQRMAIGRVVTQIFTQWEITHSRHRLPRLVPSPEHESRWLIIETAVGVMEVCTPEMGIDISSRPPDEELLTKLISSWGPRFARQWLDGTILKQWLHAEEVPEAEHSTWHAVFTPAVLRHFASNNITDPVKALTRAKHALETVLTDENLVQELGWTVGEVREMITPEIRKRFALVYISPLDGIKRVKNNLEIVLTDENLMHELGWSLEAVQEVFTVGRKKSLSVHHLTDAIGTAKIVKYNLETVMTDANLALELGWSEEEVHEAFTESRRRDFAITHTADPLKAFKNMRYNLETVLTDANLAHELEWTVDKVRSHFPPGIRKHFSAHYTNPILTAKAYKYNLETVLTDENLMHELGWSLGEVQEVFTPSIRRRVAYSNVLDPLHAIRMIKHNLGTVLTDERLAETLEWSLVRVREIFTPGRRRGLAANRLNDPLDAAKLVKKAFEIALTDANLVVELGWSLEAVQEVFTPSVRFALAINSKRDPLRSAKQMGNRLTQTLSDSSLSAAVGWDIKTTRTFFTVGIRKRLAMSYPDDPLSAARLIRSNIETILTDENLAKELKWEEGMVREIFTVGLRARYAVNCIDDPLYAAKQLKHNLEIVLTDSNLEKKLGWDVTQVRKIFTPNLRKKLAIDHPLDPLAASISWIAGRESTEKK